MDTDKRELPTKSMIASTKRTLLIAVKLLKGRLMILTLLTIILPLFPFMLAYVTKLVIDELVYISSEEHSTEFSDTLWLYVGIFLGLNILDRIINTIHTYFDTDAQYKLGEYFTLKFLKKSSELDLYHYENAKQNDLIRKAKEAYASRPQQYVGKMIWVFPDIIRVIVSISIIAVFAPVFFFIISISAVPALIVRMKTSKTVWHIWNSKTEVRRLYDSASQHLSDETSLMELRIFRTKSFLYDTVRNLFTNYFDSERKSNLKKGFWETSSTIFATFGVFSFWIYTIYKVLQGDITVGMLTFYAAASVNYASALSNFFKNISQLYDDAQYMADYYAFLDLKNKIKSGTQRLNNDHKPPRIDFKNISFSYPETQKTVLQNINLTIEPGEKVAFVGENGAGKTTLIKLLARFYDVTSGEILIDNTDLRELELEDWYSQLGILFQNFVKYSFLPAGKSIAVGDIEKLSDEHAIVEAARKAGAHEFIEQLHNGYAQILSKHFPEGTDLSGGQWQRIALARAFFRDAPILILDEPTSAIDAKGEYEIFQRLYEFAHEKTVIIISHRFSTVRQADKIYVLDDGQIIEQGTHSELMGLNGKYKKAFEAQAEGYK